MRVAICSSSDELIDDKYKNSARKIITFLANNDCDLVWGSASSSIMGICYDEFSKKGRKIHGFTTEKYVDDLKNLPNAAHKVCDNTFLMKQEIFNNSDMILFLPGGIGTISEFFAYLEEVRSNGSNKILIIYNEDHHFDTALRLIEDLVQRNFNSKSMYGCFNVINNIEEFKKYFIEKINKI